MKATESMTIGLIADIHGNIQALEAVLAALSEVDVILCAGDVVAYGANPNAVIARLKEAGIPSVAGNYDDAVAWDKAKASRKASSPRNEPLKQAALDWCKQAIRADSKQYLRGLPWRLHYHFAGKSLSVIHAGLDFLDEWLVPEDEALLAEVATRLQSDVVVLAHSHRAFSINVADTLFINPGAVGRALDGDVRASYAVLELPSLELRHHRVSYNIKETLEAIRRSHLPSGMARDIALLMKHGARRIDDIRTDDARIDDTHMENTSENTRMENISSEDVMA